MTVVEREIFISAAPEDIQAYNTNPHNAPDWYEGITDVEADYETPYVGGVVKQYYSVAGITQDMTLTVEEFEPGLVVWRMDGMVTGTFRWDYIEQDGGTLLKGTIDYEMSGGLLGKIADKFMVESMNVKQMEQSMQNLKDIFET